LSGSFKATQGRALKFEQLESREVLSSATLQAVADTYTRTGVNAGTATTLETRDLNGVGGDYMAYLRFDLSGIDLTGLTNAYLTLHKVSGATVVIERFDVFGLSNQVGNTPQNWSETTLANSGLGQEYTNTTGNYVDVSRVVNLSGEGTSGANVIEQVSNSGSPQHLSGMDLVNFLNTRKADGGLATFIVLVDAGQNRNFNYASRENADVDLRPTLKLNFTPEYPANPLVLPRQMEHLDRGLIAMRRATSQVYLGWRMLGTDPTSIDFNVYRSANGGAAVKINTTPISNSTNFVDTTFNPVTTNVYHVRPVIDGIEQAMSETFTLAANAPLRQYLNVPLQIPPSQTIQMPAGSLTPPSSTDINPATGEAWGAEGQDQFVADFTANDGSVGDLDGDGQYEIVLKWEPTNGSGAGDSEFTGNTIIDAYKLDGTLLWRIDLGINARSSAAYNPFLVYDLDGDGKAEVVMRTRPGAKDGQGNNVILPGDDPHADYRDPYTGGSDGFGAVLTGLEYLTVFNGETGAALATVPFLPDRVDMSTWGDSYGHRGENLSLVVAYLDGVRPSIVAGRGIYNPLSGFAGRNELTAWNWREGELSNLWWFKAGIGYNDNINSEFMGQGNHNVAVADVDGDGFDEIVYGSMVVDHDGSGLYSTGRGHGDTIHVADMDLTNPGLEVFVPHEDTSLGNHTATTLRDAATGRILASPLVAPVDVAAGNFPDVGRGIALDIDPNHPGYEFWDSYSSSIFNAQGVPLYAKPINPGPMHTNFGVWWDDDLLRETLDNTTIGDWNYTTAGRSNLVSFGSSGINSTAGLSANNGTKSTPTFSGDILGDWREEVIWRTSDNTALQIWSTTITSTNKLYTLPHDSLYRQAMAWQNIGYNQPPNPSFFLGAGMAAPSAPLIYTVVSASSLPGDFNGDGSVDGDDLPIWQNFYGQSSSDPLPGDADGNGSVNGRDYLVWQRNFGQMSGVVAINSAMIAADETHVLAVDRAFSQLGGLRLASVGVLLNEDVAARSEQVDWEEPAAIYPELQPVFMGRTISESIVGSDEPHGQGAKSSDFKDTLIDDELGEQLVE
jgi:hypothetical protein